MKPKIFVASLGCPKNQVDTEKALFALETAGAQITTDENEADWLLVNTCGFISSAREESIDTILGLAQIKKKRPAVQLAVMGCLSELYRETLAEQVPEIDRVYGIGELGKLTSDIVANALPASAPSDPENGERILTTARHLAYLKISEGCSNKCSFCSIPRIRGPYKSRKPEDIRREANALARQGVKEIILVAQDTTLYGADIGIRNGLSELLYRLTDTPGLEWIRVMYMYPALINGTLLETFATAGKVTPYFDIPLQHADDNVLKKMNRPETNKSIRELIDAIRSTVSGAVIRTAFITGFPGETQDNFATLIRLVEDVRFDNLGAFTYSPEEGTRARSMPDTPPASVAYERMKTVMETQREISAALLREKIGSVVEIIVDGVDTNEMLLTGRTKGQAPEIDGCVILDGVDTQPGDIIPLLVTGATDYDLLCAGAQTHDQPDNAFSEDKNLLQTTRK